MTIKILKEWLSRYSDDKEIFIGCGGEACTPVGTALVNIDDNGIITLEEFDDDFVKETSVVVLDY